LAVVIPTPARAVAPSRRSSRRQPMPSGGGVISRRPIPQFHSSWTVRFDGEGEAIALQGQEPGSGGGGRVGGPVPAAQTSSVLRDQLVLGESRLDYFRCEPGSGGGAVRRTGPACARTGTNKSRRWNASFERARNLYGNALRQRTGCWHSWWTRRRSWRDQP
jgi:hypothetical protein